MTRGSTGPADQTLSAAAVLVAVFLIATCGLIYELVAGALASYLLGDSLTQFSTVIGVYLSAMGLGAWLSRFIERRLVVSFVEIEVAVGLIGGFSSSLLFLSFAELSFFRGVLYGLVALIGTLVGLEIPLLMRILKDQYDLKDLVARVLTVDYLGALVASLFFPLFLVPKLGLVKGALAVGLLNAIVALWSTHLFRKLVPRFQMNLLRVQTVVAIAILLGGFVYATELSSLAEGELYPDDIVYAKTSKYQRIVVTRSRSSFQLYLNGNLQFSSVDEHRYHEALVHPAMAVARSKTATAGVRRVLVLGGGDGLGVREILKHEGVKAVTVVDLDPLITELAATHPLIESQNRSALADPRVRVINTDAFVYLDELARAQKTGAFDVAIIDFPDPNNFSLGKLYTTRFYHLVRSALAPEGVMVVQATSPLMARQSFWCVVETIEASGFVARPFHANVPSFGEWGYVLAARQPFDIPQALPDAELLYLNPKVMASLFEFPPDMAKVEAEVNRLNNQILVRYYGDEWARWF